MVMTDDDRRFDVTCGPVRPLLLTGSLCPLCMQ